MGICKTSRALYPFAKPHAQTRKSHASDVIKTSHWTVENARAIRPTPENTFPAFDPDKLGLLMPGYQAWDNWLVRDEDGFVADVGGFSVLIALVRPIGADFSQGERIAYFYSADGVHYNVGGFLFEDAQIYAGIREWSGSTTLLDDGRIQTYYTCSYGKDFDGVWETVQRFAVSIQDFEVVKDEEGEDTLVIAKPSFNALLGGACEPDGYFYETPAQAALREGRLPTRHSAVNGSDQTDNNCFRDPFRFRDPKTGKRFLIFEANTGSQHHPVGFIRNEYLGKNGLTDAGFASNEDMVKANGCIGVIELTDEDGTYGILREPILTSNLVTDEIERINMITHDGHYYLFCVGHGNKNALVAENPDLINRDYMLGFRSKSLFGPFEPLNKSGVVVQQKSFGAAYTGQAENEQYVYSWLITPRKDQKKGIFNCVAYANYCNTGKGVEAVMGAAPSVSIEINGLKTRIVGMHYDILPAPAKKGAVTPEKPTGDEGKPSNHGNY